MDSLKDRLKKKCARLLRNEAADITFIEIIKKSIDARKKDAINLVFTVDVSCKGEERILKKNKDKNIQKASRVSYEPIVTNRSDNKKNIIIAGAGPCGLFAAYILALNGYSPLLIERGDCIEKRTQTVKQFWEAGSLNKESNVQFGEGGAGAFSDGKLNTGVKDPSGRIDYVLRVFNECGASEDILYEQKPHVGTDVLYDVVRNLRNRIIEAGGRIRFNTCLTDIIFENNRVCRVKVNESEELLCDTLILAIGHSARDTFIRLRELGLLMECKDFAVGFRVMHSQNIINISQYGEKYKDYFGAAPYKLAEKAGEKGVYSFCMCPGGYVVNSSSEEDALCVNGMSYHDRGSENANSAIVVSVNKADYEKALSNAGIAYESDDPLIGMYYQRLLEKRAYIKGNGRIPVQRFLDFVNNKATESAGEIIPQIKGQYCYSSLKGILESETEEAFIQGMRQMGRKISGFDAPDTLLAGVEARTSSPVRIKRNEQGESSVKGLYPAGEGAGYAGGITSAAVDGIRIAEYIMKEGMENA